MDDLFFEESFKEIEEVAQSLISRGKSETHAIMVATNLCCAASQIYESLGGKKLAAAQFYGAADRLVGEVKK